MDSGLSCDAKIRTSAVDSSAIHYWRIDVRDESFVRPPPIMRQVKSLLHCCLLSSLHLDAPHDISYRNRRRKPATSTTSFARFRSSYPTWSEALTTGRCGRYLTYGLVRLNNDISRFDQNWSRYRLDEKRSQTCNYWGPGAPNSRQCP